jgi:hypothetical protein
MRKPPLLACLLPFALAAMANEPAKDFDTPVRAANLDASAYACWDPGTDPHEKPLPGKVSDGIWAQGLPQPHFQGVTFGKSKTPGERHLRIGFLEPVGIGSVLVRGGVRVSALKPDAPYPGDLSDDSLWIPGERLTAGGVTAKEPGGRGAVALWTFPSVVPTRALRFSRASVAGANQMDANLGGAMALSARWANLSPLATATARSNPSSARKIVNGSDDGWGAWENIKTGQAGKREPISGENAEWLLLTWPGPVPLGSIMTEWTGFQSADVQVYTGPETVHPVDADDSAWRTVARPDDFVSGYPVALWPCFEAFDEPVATRALRLRITAVTKVSHPHVLKSPAGGKRVWLGELLAAADLGDAPLAPPVFEEPEEAHPPIPIEFATPGDGYVTLVIEDAATGRRVRNLVSETFFPKGRNTAWWDGSDDLKRDTDAARHGLWRIPVRFVEPGTYRVRGLWHAGVEPVYEFSVYAPGNPPWEVPDHTGAWLANHSAPQAAAFVPAGRSPFGEPAVFLGAAVTEGPDGLIWTDLDGVKRGGVKWLGGIWTAAPTLCCDAGPDASPGIAVFAASIWRDGGKPAELRLTALRGKGGSLQADERFNGAFHPSGEGTPAPDHAYPLAGIAAWNRNVYATFPSFHRIVRFAEDGKTAAEGIDVPAPRGIAAESDGALLVVSSNAIVRLRPGADGSLAGVRFETAETVAKDLDRPRDLAVGPDGRIYVSLRGGSHQVRVFSRDGAPLHAIGRKGEPSAGPYDEMRMNNPAGLAVDSRGRLWVAECDYVPKRISVWDAADGTLVRAFYGPAKYGGGGALARDERDRFFYADEGRGTLEFELDWKAGSHRLVNVPYRAAPDDARARIGGAAPEHVFTFRRRRYYSNSYNSHPCAGPSSAILFIDRDGLARPVAAVASANAGTLLETAEFASLRPSGPKAKPGAKPSSKTPAWFLWCDRNGDADVQPGEVEVRPGRMQGVLVQEDLSFAIANLDGASCRLPAGSVARDGTPSYTLDALETVATNVSLSPSSGGCQMLVGKDGRTAALTLGVRPFSAYSVSGVASDGSPAWSLPNPWPGLHASHHCDTPKEPGQLIGVTRLLGGLFEPKGAKVGPLWAVNGNMGNLYLLTLDGLFVSTVFKDVRQGQLWRMPVAERGMSLKGITLHDENFWPTIACPPDGKVYVVNGCESAIVRLKGLETLRPIRPFDIVVTDAHLRASLDFAARREELRRAARGSGVMRARLLGEAPVVDGALDEWRAAEWVEIDTSGRGANFNSDARPYSFHGAVAAADGRLYAAWDTSEAKLLRNSGESPDLLFKTGGALDLMIASDPEADPGRRTAAAGDKRLLVTRVDGRTRAVLYTAVVPGTPEDARTPFRSPWRTLFFDRVEDVSDRVELADDGKGAYEISVPLDVLGLSPAPGLRHGLDIGILRGTGTETTARVYWSNKATGITADVPSEAELQPAFWGTAAWEQGK